MPTSLILFGLWPRADDIVAILGKTIGFSEGVQESKRERRNRSTPPYLAGGLASNSG